MDWGGVGATAVDGAMSGMIGGGLGKAAKAAKGLRRVAQGGRPPNMSPPGAGRRGAFREAKRQNGIPVGQQPSEVKVNVGNRAQRQPGRVYEYDRGPGNPPHRFETMPPDTTMGQTIPRIEDLTSMTRKTTMLTTEPERLVAEDVFRDNDVLNMPIPAEGPHPSLGSLTWIAHVVQEDRPQEVAWLCLERAVQYVAHVLPRYSLWLCATESGYNNTATRYRGLWKSLFSRVSTTVPFAPLSAETCVETDDGRLVFFGCVQLAPNELTFAHSIIHASPRSFLISLPDGKEPALNDFISRGWSYGFFLRETLRDVAFSVAGQYGILYYPFGFFDDIEAGVDCIMRPEELHRITGAS